MIPPGRLDDRTWLGPAARSRGLDRVRREPFDLVVVGGGVTGAGVALDATTRGMRVALVEQHDLAAGTSSRSSKLIHGGLRYLEQFQFRLVFEALRERGLMLSRLAPHLVRPVSFLYPLTHRVWERGYVGAGIGLYDLLAMRGQGRLPRHRHHTRSRALELAPGLRPDSLVGAVRYWDAQVDDARHTMTLARTASGYGATVLTSLRVVDLERSGDQVVGVQVEDLETGEELVVRAHQVVNATGVWTDQIEEMAGRAGLQVRASKGIHLVVPRELIRSETGLILRTRTSVLFVIPWGSHWIVGTTDTDWNLDLAHPAASSADIDYLLGQANRLLVDPIAHHDIRGVYAGLRPLLAGESDDTSKLSREHAVLRAAPGLVSVAGGKYTTYRVMAADAVDAAAGDMDRSWPASLTDRIPLVGAVGWETLANRRAALADESGVPRTSIDHLLGRYGTCAGDLLALVAEDSSLADPLPGAEPYLAAEVVYAAVAEGALHLHDVLTRRTRISIETPDRGVTAARPAAELMAPVLGWDRATVDREVGYYESRVAAELASQRQPDDHSADAVRLGAPDVRTRGQS